MHEIQDNYDKNKHNNNENIFKKKEYQIITNSNYITFCDNVSIIFFSFPFQMQCILLLFFISDL